MNDRSAAFGSWAAPGELPEVGVRYEFEDFVGARFTGTLSKLMLNEAGYEPVAMEFEDRGGFETNLPIRFREALS